jgi:hypothetical protein
MKQNLNSGGDMGYELSNEERERIRQDVRRVQEPFLREGVARLERLSVLEQQFSTRVEMLQYWQRTHEVVVHEQPEYRNGSPYDRAVIDVRVAMVLEIIDELIHEAMN